MNYKSFKEFDTVLCNVFMSDEINPKHIISFDPAISTGYAIFTISSDLIVTLDKFGIIKVDTTSPYQGDYMLSLRNQIINILDSLTHRVEYIHIESFFFNKKFCAGADLNIVLRSAIYQLAREREIAYSMHAPTHWKKFIATRARPNARDIEKHGKNKAAKAYIVDALKTRFNIHFPAHTFINGRRCAFRYDVSDAVAIGIYGILVDNPAAKITEYTHTGEILVQLASGTLTNSDR